MSNQSRDGKLSSSEDESWRDTSSSKPVGIPNYSFSIHFGERAGPIRPCHPERSEGPWFLPARANTKIPRFARDDKRVLVGTFSEINRWRRSEAVRACARGPVHTEIRE